MSTKPRQAGSSMRRSFFHTVFCLAWATSSYAAGTLDPSFGDDGLVVIEAPFGPASSNEYVEDMIVDSQGLYVTVGAVEMTEEHAPVAGLATRNLRNGAPDPGFGGKGFVHLQWQGKPLSFDIVRETSGGKLLVAGRRPKTPGLEAIPLVCRLRSSGELDLGFAAGGCRVLTEFNGSPGFTEVLNMEIQADGRIVMLGRPSPSVSRSFALVRLMPNGAEDLEFGGQECDSPAPRCGIVYSAVQLSPMVYAKGLSIDSKQRMIVGVSFNGGGTWRIMTAFRFDPQGAPDIVFESVNFSSLTGVEATTHQVAQIRSTPDDGLFVSGYAQVQSTILAGVAKLHEDGSRDPSFGIAGRAVYSFDAQHEQTFFGSILLQSDGKLIFAGSGSGNDPSRCYVMQIHADDGAVDEGFGNNGISELRVLKDIASGGCGIKAIVPDGAQLVIAGMAYGDQGADPYLVRMERDDLFKDAFETPSVH